jgi:hypothetical protein
MRKLFYLITAFTLFTYKASSQINGNQIGRLKIFVDCVNANCDRTFFRTEITLVDFLFDNKAADVHILITEQNTGGGGEQYQLIFFGQNRFSKITDTIRFNTDPNATDFEIRDQLIIYLKLGLSPFIAKTAAAKDAKIDFKTGSSNAVNEKNQESATKDPWNYWVFRAGVDAFLRADAVYKSSNLRSDVSANRTTEDIKVGVEARIGKNTSEYEFEDSLGINKIVVKNNNYRLEHFLIKSISNHWSAGYSTELERSTFENTKRSISLKAAVEYNIFPYKQVNTKFFALRYFLDVRRNNYFDSTLYDKVEETLFGHGAEAKLSFNQKWGTTSLGVEYHNYFRNGNLFNLGANARVDVRITGGLSFNIYAFGELVRDQLSLPKEGATGEEVLTRRRQLASGYNYFLSFGLNYRFGSKLNNFVNPRFN